MYMNTLFTSGIKHRESKEQNTEKKNKIYNNLDTSRNINNNGKITKIIPYYNKQKYNNVKNNNVKNNSIYDKNKPYKYNYNYKFVFIVTGYNNGKYYKKNLDSIINQNYKNWRVIYVDDSSTDNTYEGVNNYIINNKLEKRITLIRNNKNMKQGYGRYIAFHMCDDTDICCLLDGDDWLYDGNVLAKLNKFYNEIDVLLTYGGMCKRIESKTYNQIFNKKFPKSVIRNKSYLEYQWLCYHLRSGFAKVFKIIPESYQKDSDGKWLKCSTDAAIMYPAMHIVGDKHSAVNFKTYIYNVDSTVTYKSSFYNQNTEWKDYRTEIHKYFKTLDYNLPFVPEEFRKKVFNNIKIIYDSDKFQQEIEQIDNNLGNNVDIFKEKISCVNNIFLNNGYDYILLLLEKPLNIDILENLIKYNINIIILANNSDNYYENYKDKIIFIKDLYDIYNLYLKHKYKNISFVKKNFGQYNEVYKYSVVIEQENKSYIHNYAEKIYCINLINNNMRLENMIQKLNKYKISAEIIRVKHGKHTTFKNIVDINNKNVNKNKLWILNYGEVGCSLSHLLCLIDAKDNKYKNIVVFEDDVILIKDFEEKIKTYHQQFLTNKYIYLGSSQWSWNNIKILGNYYRPNRTCGAFGLFIDSEVFDILIEELKKNRYKADIIPWMLYNNDSKYIDKCCVLYPNLCIADVTSSDIRDKQNMEERSKKMKWDLELYDF